MTYISQNFFGLDNSNNNDPKFYSVEIVTFNGESFIEEVEAYSAEEAQAIAAGMYDDVDYTMVQACFVA